jgi:hypothetical protein
MAQLVLLVVAAAWAAVLIPPMLRSRVENRPNSSVTDFRRQLSTLQSTSSPRLRTIGRPLAPSPLQRPAAAGRPGHPHHRQAALHGSTATRPRPAGPPQTDRGQATFRTHGGGEPAHRQTHMDRSRDARRAADPRTDVRRRRSNVLFLLVITTACSLFLAATTSSTVLLYVFALSFLALSGYVYLLAQLRRREASGWGDGWLEQR